MAVYCDEPKWERHHGLSGHLIADNLGELDAFAQALGLGSNERMFFCTCPHYQLPATRMDDALAAGAVKLSRADFMKRVNALVNSVRHEGWRPSSDDGRPAPRRGFRASVPRPKPAAPQAPVQDVLFAWTPPD